MLQRFSASRAGMLAALQALEVSLYGDVYRRKRFFACGNRRNFDAFYVPMIM
jgi:hypothetical protein